MVATVATGPMSLVGFTYCRSGTVKKRAIGDCVPERRTTTSEIEYSAPRRNPDSS